jgi:hypothetical protein
MARRGPGPHTVWAGVVVKLDDGTTHAFEFDGVANFLTADVITSGANSPQRIIVKVEGIGVYWAEAKDFGPDVNRPKELSESQKAIEGEVI